MIGGSLFYDFARVGATPAPFQSFVLSAGVVTDYVYGAGMHWQGGCGGIFCDGSGSLNELNVIGELKAATPLGGGNTLNGYIAAGAAIFWPSGHPTGGTTSFLAQAGGRDFIFITIWSHFLALKGVFGESWRESFLPQGYAEIIEAHSIEHYELTDSLVLGL